VQNRSRGELRGRHAWVYIGLTSVRRACPKRPRFQACRGLDVTNAEPGGVNSVSGRMFAFAAYETTDAQQHSTAISECHHVYEQLERGPFRGRITELLLDSIHILRDQVFSPHGYVGASWTGSQVFFSFLPSGGTAYCHGREVCGNTILKYPSNHLCRAYSSGPIDCLAIAVRDDVIAAESSQLTGQEIAPDLLRRLIYLPHEELAARFQHCAMDLLNQATLTPSLLDDANWQQGAKQDVLQMLLEVVQHGISSAQKLPPPSTRAYVVDKAIEYMRANIASPPVLSDICRTIRVSPRTLRYSFEEILGVSPVHYLLSLRLRRVRDELLDGRGENGIYRVAQSYGFCHMGRFALFYKQAFGELPSDTCRLAAS
jgi:AraC family ethanolamine operon transcriptional activator